MSHNCVLIRMNKHKRFPPRWEPQILLLPLFDNNNREEEGKKAVGRILDMWWKMINSKQIWKETHKLLQPIITVGPWGKPVTGLPPTMHFGDFRAKGAALCHEGGLSTQPNSPHLYFSSPHDHCVPLCYIMGPEENTVREKWGYSHKSPSQLPVCIRVYTHTQLYILGTVT